MRQMFPHRRKVYRRGLTHPLQVVNVGLKGSERGEDRFAECGFALSRGWLRHSGCTRPGCFSAAAQLQALHRGWVAESRRLHRTRWVVRWSAPLANPDWFRLHRLLQCCLDRGKLSLRAVTSPFMAVSCATRAFLFARSWCI